MDRSVCQQLVQSFVDFLRNELAQGTASLSDESAESVEVAVQCLETAYALPVPSSASTNLYELFRNATLTSQTSSHQSCSVPTATSAADKEQAEKLKNEGNTKMREEKFAESIASYSKAIELDPSNAVYYCNRAAAHSKLNNHTAAIGDCKKALELQPNYSKAYGRMGLAHSSLQQHEAARDCYKKALELEPDNEGYASNLAISEEKLRSTAQPSNPLAGLLSGGGGLAGLSGAFTNSGAPDLSALLSNPGLMNMASQLMTDPNMQNLMANILGGVSNAAPAAGNSSAGQGEAPPAGGGGIDALLNAGRQLAEQMQTEHPDLLAQLRSQMDRNHQPQP